MSLWKDSLGCVTDKKQVGQRCVSGEFLWCPSLKCFCGVCHLDVSLVRFCGKYLRHESLERFSGVCHCFDGDEHFRRLCNTACPIACNNMCNPARCIVRFAAGGPQIHARMAKPAVRCASLTLNAATCELNGYGKAAEILLALAEPHTQCHGCHPNLTISVLCFAVLRLLCFTCLCFPLLCHA